jgi:hypothetical protein
VLDQLKEAIAPYSFVLLLVIINIRVLREYVVSRPIHLVMSALQSLFQTQIGFAS